MRRRNCKLRDFPLSGAKINCGRFSHKIQGEESSGQRHQYFVTGDNHNYVRFYEFLGEQQLLSFSSNANNTVQSQVSAVAVSWDQTSIFSGSNRGIINVWDVLEGKNTPICTLKGHATSVNCFGLFPGEQHLVASGSYDTQIKLWDHRSKQNFATLKGHNKQINWIDIAPDGSCLLSGSQDGTTKIWDIGTQKVITTYTDHSAPVLRSIFHPEDRMFASCSADRTAKFFSCDPSKKAFECVSSTELVSMPITAIDFSPDGTLLCTGGNDILKIWNMRKNGLLIQSIDSAWKGVQDLLWCDKGIKGISSNAGNLSVWFCYLAQKKQSPQKSEQQSQFKLPKIFKNPSMRRQNNSQQGQRKIKPMQNYSRDSEQTIPNPKQAQRNKDLEEVMNNVNLALGHLNSVAEIKSRQQKQKQEAKKQLEREKQRERKQQQKIKEEQRKQRIRLQKQKQREQRQNKERERRQKLQRQKEEEQRKKQQRLEELERQRIERQKNLHQKLHQTFEKNNNYNNFELTIENDALENSSVMNISAFMGNGAQKQKLMQIEAIGQFMKQSGRFQSVYKMRSSYVKPIIHYWKQGKIQSALYTLAQADVAVAFDCLSAILHNSTFKMAITPDVACSLIKKLVQVMHNKHSTYVKNSMLYLNEIVLMFKDQLIKVKMFNPLTRVDLSRQQRLAKYDRLTEQFLNVFKQDRLKKYALQAKSSQNEELNSIAGELYKNLQQLLRKIMPKKEPEAV